MYIKRQFTHHDKLYCLFIWQSSIGRGLDSWTLLEWQPATEYWRSVAGSFQDMRPCSRRVSVVRQIKEARAFAS